jgi:hypothetical protein
VWDTHSCPSPLTLDFEGFELTLTIFAYQTPAASPQSEHSTGLMG